MSDAYDGGMFIRRIHQISLLGISMPGRRKLRKDTLLSVHPFSLPRQRCPLSRPPPMRPQGQRAGKDAQ